MKTSDWNFLYYAIWGIGAYFWAFNLKYPLQTRFSISLLYLVIGIIFNLVGRINYAKGN